MLRTRQGVVRPGNGLPRGIPIATPTVSKTRVTSFFPKKTYDVSFLAVAVVKRGPNRYTEAGLARSAGPPPKPLLAEGFRQFPPRMPAERIFVV